MKRGNAAFARQYRAALEEHLAGGGEESLQRGYEIVRKAMQRGLGLIDLILIHQKFLTARMRKARALASAVALKVAATQFLIECLSSYEMVQMGFRDAIAGLKRSAAELSIANTRLEKEVGERLQAETELRRLNLELQREISERKKVEKEVLEISQKEQRRFGAELHDSLCQKLVGISMLMRGLVRNSKIASESAVAELEKLAGLVDESVQEARDMAHGLYPVDLEANALMISLRELALRIQTNHPLSCTFHCPQVILIRDNNVATHLYRIAQEGINNALRHGTAQNVLICLEKREGKVVLTVSDDGRGMRRSRSMRPKGIGLQIMKYRARMIDADLQFQKSGRGVSLTCSVPLVRRAAAQAT